MIRPVALAIAAVGVLGCVSHGRFFVGSEDVITRPREAAGSPDMAFGYQGRIVTESQIYFGELVACDDRGVYLHVNAIPAPWVTVPWSSIRLADARVATSTMRTGLIVWNVLGAASSISHGYGAIFSMPIWAVVGLPTIAWAVEEEHFSGRCADLRPYMRFPQGLPKAMRAHFEEAPAPGKTAPTPSAPPVPPAPPAPPPGAPPPSVPAPPSTSPGPTTAPPASALPAPPAAPPVQAPPSGPTAPPKH